MKTNRLISIALVTILALTVVSGAGVLTATKAAAELSSTDIATALDCSSLGWTFAASQYSGSVAVGVGNPRPVSGSACVQAYAYGVGAYAMVQTTASDSGQVTFAWSLVGASGAGTRVVFTISDSGGNVIKAVTVSETDPMWQSGWETVGPIDVAKGQVLTWRVQGDNGYVQMYLDYLRFTPVTEESVKTKITTLQADTLSTMFSNPNNHKAFDAKLDAVYKLVDAGTAESYALAMDKIQIDLMPKTDGVAPDWVTATEQQAIYDNLQSIYDDLVLLST